MTLPGTSFLQRAGTSRRGVPTFTGVTMIVGTAERGPTDKPYPCRSMAEFTALYGNRNTSYNLYDYMYVLFKIGAGLIYVQRIVGPSAAYDTNSFLDRAGTPLATLAIRTAGQNASNLTAQITNGVGANTFVIIVADSVLATTLETSPDLTSPAAAVEWASNSKWIRITDSGSATAAPNNNPAVIGATALNAGADDIVNLVDTQRTAALDKFTADLGPGQVLIPGITTTAVHTALLLHGFTYGRTPLLDGPNTSVAATAISPAAAQRSALAYVSWGGYFAGAWVKVPGLYPNTTLTIPPSVIAAGLMARSDQTQNPNIPAAGENGFVDYALDVTQTFNAADRELLNNAGVNLFRNWFGVRLYGYRTLVDPAGLEADWVNLGNQRLRMLIVALGNAIAEKYVFAQIDGQGHKLSEFGGALTGMLSILYTQGALYGATAVDAFSVDVGPTVNTPTTLAAQEIHAELSVAMSPMGERVIIGLSKTPINQ